MAATAFTLESAYDSVKPAKDAKAEETARELREA